MNKDQRFRGDFDLKTTQAWLTSVVFDTCKKCISHMHLLHLCNGKFDPISAVRAAMGAPAF